MIATYIKESTMLGSLSDLKMFLKDNYPTDIWKAGASLGVASMPQKMVEKPSSSLISYYYPDKSEGKWFMLGDYLVVSGTVTGSGIIECFVRVLHMDTSDHLVRAVRVFYYCMESEKLTVPMTRKKLAIFMRNLMKKAVRFHDIDDVIKFLENEENKDFMRRQEI